MRPSNLGEAGQCYAHVWNGWNRWGVAANSKEPAFTLSKPVGEGGLGRDKTAICVLKGQGERAVSRRTKFQIPFLSAIAHNGCAGCKELQSCSQPTEPVARPKGDVEHPCACMHRTSATIFRAHRGHNSVLEQHFIYASVGRAATI